MGLLIYSYSDAIRNVSPYRGLISNAIGYGFNNADKNAPNITEKMVPNINDA